MAQNWKNNKFKKFLNEKWLALKSKDWIDDDQTLEETNFKKIILDISSITKIKVKNVLDMKRSGITKKTLKREKKKSYLNLIV